MQIDNINIGLLGKYPIGVIILDCIKVNDTNNAGNKSLNLNSGTIKAIKKIIRFPVGGVWSIEFHDNRIKVSII